MTLIIPEDHALHVAGAVREAVAALAIVGAEYVLRLLPRGTHEYARFVRPSELARWCRDAGLDLAATRGMQYVEIALELGIGERTVRKYAGAIRRTLRAATMVQAAHIATKAGLL